jgi:NAD(P)-dependent dehydrogenase (short-subunit alcohol dehydrogenase family)
MLKGRLALITGSGSGIGLQTAKTFSKEGAIVILSDLVDNLDEVIQDLESENKEPRGHSYFRCDVSKSDQVKDLFTKIQQRYPKFGVPNVIVNNAGILISKLLVDLTEEDYDKVIDINVKGTFLITQEATKRLVENFPNVSLEPLHTYASIINISSISGKNGCREETHYSASKAAVEGKCQVFFFNYFSNQLIVHVFKALPEVVQKN